MKIIDLNADLGEGMPHEQEILPLISSANICCGAHAGSPEITRATVESCLQLGIRIGAHPGYPDPEYFGRQSFMTLKIKPGPLFNQMVKQTNLIPEAKYIKPHGAFYNDTASRAYRYDHLGAKKYKKIKEDYSPKPDDIYNVLHASLIITKLPLMGLANTYHSQIARNAHVLFIPEGFIDRRYDNNHRLLPRSNPDAIIHEPQEAIDQALRLAKTCDSLCVHGDNPNAPELLTKVRQALENDGYTIAPK
ncbi:hypothetical protein C0431_00830 [bacterium]|jgi:5-oxoprolinase (ATP-hydrolysing) subunit A|nr:hypothetical protein [bacterium]